MNAVVKYAATNHNWPVTLDYDDYSRADGSADAVANRKLNSQFVVPACAAAPGFDAPGFQALSLDLCPHVNLAEFHSVAHDSFAAHKEKDKIEKNFNFFFGLNEIRNTPCSMSK